MDASTCIYIYIYIYIYMYCNIERNIMKNQSGSPDFLIQGKISVYLFCVSRHCIFSIFLEFV